jgi:chemotaxis protein methyltransferase CheR
MNVSMEDILQHLKQERGFDFGGYRPSMIERRVGQRMSAVGCRGFDAYSDYLHNHPDETDKLADALTIHVSRFFRNPLMFEYLARKILPRMLQEKAERGEHSFRVWSAGCSFGEEAYSVAILLHELCSKETFRHDGYIFGTDIDSGALNRARMACYPYESVKDVRYGLLKRYFIPVGSRPNEWVGSSHESFQVVDSIRDAVSFSLYDMLHPNTFAPPESVFGSFDLVLCRNLLIYFNSDYQNRILEKLHRSVSLHGHLILGESEAPTSAYQQAFRQVDGCCRIYQKV